MAPLIVLFSVFGLALLFTRLRGRAERSDGESFAKTLRVGRIALASMFVFTGTSHFYLTEEMMEMLPPIVPEPRLIVWTSGALEVVAALGLLVERTRRSAAWALASFLVLAFPANVYAAFAHADVGGPIDGPFYLFIRAPIQLVFLGWTIYFGVRNPATRRF